MFNTLSAQQKKIWDYYYDYYKKNWVCPTYADAAEFFEISTAGVFKHVINLEKLGYLYRSASWVVSLFLSNLSRVKVIAKASCGYGNNISDVDIEEYSDSHQEIEVPSAMIKNWDAWYALIAEWDSMKDIWINNWDYLVIKYQSFAQNGDIVVAIIKDGFEEKATIKQYWKGPQEILKPKNSLFRPIILDENTQAEIRWKLVWVIRKY